MAVQLVDTDFQKLITIEQILWNATIDVYTFAQDRSHFYPGKLESQIIIEKYISTSLIPHQLRIPIAHKIGVSFSTVTAKPPSTYVLEVLTKLPNASWPSAAKTNKQLRDK